MKLIKQINDSIKPVDPVLEAIKKVDSFAPTRLDDAQIMGLIDYMRQLRDNARKDNKTLAVEDAAGMALEDVPGFETVTSREMQATINRLAQAYVKKWGK